MSNAMSRFKIPVVAFTQKNYITSFLNSLFKKKQMAKTYKHPEVKVDLKVIQLLNKIMILQEYLSHRQRLNQRVIENWLQRKNEMRYYSHYG